MRRLRKQSTAIVLAAMMMGSVVPQGTNFITPCVVMAATEEYVYDSGDAAAKVENIDFSTLTEESWDKGVKKEITFAYTNDTVRNVTSNFTVNVRVGISPDDYNTLEKDGNYIKLQGVVKLGNDWAYTKGDSWPYLDKAQFSAGDDGNYYADASIEFKDKDASQLMEIDFEVVGVGFKGTVNFDKVSVKNNEVKTPELTPEEANVLESFSEETSINRWSGEDGYQYFNGGDKNAAPSIDYDVNGDDGRLKVTLDYSANSKESWSEAKVKYIAPDGGVDISNYNQISVDVIIPEGINSIKKMKFFSDDVINKDTAIDFESAESLGNGYQKIKVTMGYSPKTDMKLTDLTIGLIGENSSFSGDIYLDNLELSQKDDSEDFVKITRTANETGTQSKYSAENRTLKITDNNLADCAVALQSYLNGLSEKDQVLFGHQNDVSRSVSTSDELGDVHDVTGSVSGVFGIDSLALTGSEAGGKDAASALANSVAYSKKAAENGSIISLSAHMPNFTNSKIKKTADGKYDFFNCDFEESKDLSNDSLKQILPGGDYNEVYQAYLDIIADYALKLQEDNIPVMFRPFHENTGAWFWWGSTNSEESYKSLYRYTRQYLEGKGVHNMLYIYSPCGPVSSEDEVLSRYPGDEYVDILAFDYYDDYNSYPATSDGSYFEHLDETCKIVSSVAKEHGKIAAIAECGVRVMKKDGSDNEGLLVKGNPVSKEKSGTNWYQKVSDIAKENNMPYYLVWANFSDTNFYVPYKHNDEYGQEMINDFIDYYNDESSVFGDGTNFYSKIKDYADTATKSNYTTSAGFMVSVFDMDELVEDTTLRAYVKNAAEVKFVVTDTMSGRNISIKAVPSDEPVTYGADSSEVSTYAAASGTRLYTAKLTKELMDKVGKTDVAAISVVADGKTIQTIENVSLGKTKDAAASNVFDDFDYYSGSQSLLSAAYTENSAGGCSSSFSLDKDNKADGTYGGKFSYKLKTTGSEVWTGRVKSSLKVNDFSEYNALQMWVKPDGKGQKLVIQLVDGNGGEYEAYLTDFVKTTEAKYVTIPFENFHKKGSGASLSDVSNITKFAIWCNSYPAGDAVDVESAIYFDGIRAVQITDEQAALADTNGLVITDSAIGLPALSTDDGKTDDGKTDDSKADDGKTDDSKADDSKSDDSKADDSKTDDSKADDGKTDDSKADDGKTDDSKADDSKTDDSKAGDNKTDDIKADGSSKVDAGKADNGTNGAGITDNVKTADNKNGETKSGNVKAKNNKVSPKSGDEYNMGMHAALMSIAAFIVSVVLIRRKKSVHSIADNNKKANKRV